MSNELFNQMLSAYDLATHQQKRNATFEVNQQIILAGLYNGGRHLPTHLPWPAAILRGHGLLATCSKPRL